MSELNNGELADARRDIDAIDRDMVRLLAQRLACVDRVVEIKRRDGLPARNARVDEVIARVRRHAEDAGVPPAFTENVWRAMIEWVIGYEEHRLSSTTNTRS